MYKLHELGEIGLDVDYFDTLKKKPEMPEAGNAVKQEGKTSAATVDAAAPNDPTSKVFQPESPDKVKATLTNESSDARGEC